jgi:CBS domain-containing protein
LVGDFQTIERALSRINAHEIRSLPVVNKDKIVIGVVDVMDLTRSITESLKTMGDIQPKPYDSGKMRERNDFMGKTVGSLLTPEKKKTFVAANHLSLLLTVEYLVRTGQERFLIVDRDVLGNVHEQEQPEEFLDGIVTQSDCIKFLAENITLLRQEPLFQKTLSELGLGNRKPYIISHKEQAAKAFIEMTDKGFDSAAIVDDNGRLMAVISASDLKGLTRRNCVVLTENVENFLNRDWKRGWWVRPLTVDLSDPLFFVVLQFVSSKVHRMYIVDDDGLPIGEVNHLDILQILLQIQ